MTTRILPVAALAVAAMFLLTGASCATDSLFSGALPSTASASKHPAVDDKAALALEASYNEVAAAYLGALRTNVKGEPLARLKALRGQARIIRDQGRRAYDAFNSGDLAQQVNLLKDIANQAKSVLPH